MVHIIKENLISTLETSFKWNQCEIQIFYFQYEVQLNKMNSHLYSLFSWLFFFK